MSSEEKVAVRVEEANGAVMVDQPSNGSVLNKLMSWLTSSVDVLGMAVPMWILVALLVVLVAVLCQKEMSGQQGSLPLVSPTETMTSETPEIIRKILG
jgi:hypothetical protein